MQTPPPPSNSILHRQPPTWEETKEMMHGAFYLIRLKYGPQQDPTNEHRGEGEGEDESMIPVGVPVGLPVGMPEPCLKWPTTPEPPPTRRYPIPRAGRLPGFYWSVGSLVRLRPLQELSTQRQKALHGYAGECVEIVKEMQWPSTWISVRAFDGREFRVRSGELEMEYKL